MSDNTNEIQHTDSWLWRVFDKLAAYTSPFQLVRPDNPVFQWELSRLRWPSAPQPEQLAKYVSSVAFVYPFILGLLCILLTVLSPYRMFGIVDDLTLLILISTFLFDIYYLRVTLPIIGQQKQSGHWAMIQLTPLSRHEIVRAEWAVAQIRAWRMAALELGLRLFSGIVFIYGPMVFDIVRNPNRFSLSFFVSLSILSVCLLAVLVESVWRVKTFTAIGLAISAQGADTAKSGLSAFAAIIGVRMAEAALLFGGLVVFSKLVEAVMVRRDIFGRETILPALIIGFGAVVTTTLLHRMFAIMQRIALHFVMRFAFDSE